MECFKIWLIVVVSVVGFAVLFHGTLAIPYLCNFCVLNMIGRNWYEPPMTTQFLKEDPMEKYMKCHFASYIIHAVSFIWVTVWIVMAGVGMCARCGSSCGFMVTLIIFGALSTLSYLVAMSLDWAVREDLEEKLAELMKEAENDRARKRRSVEDLHAPTEFINDQYFDQSKTSSFDGNDSSLRFGDKPDADSKFGYNLSEQAVQAMNSRLAMFFITLLLFAGAFVCTIMAAVATCK